MGTAPPILQEPERMGKLDRNQINPDKPNFIHPCVLHISHSCSYAYILFPQIVAFFKSPVRSRRTS